MSASSGDSHDLKSPGCNKFQTLHCSLYFAHAAPYFNESYICELSINKLSDFVTHVEIYFEYLSEWYLLRSMYICIYTSCAYNFE